MDKTITIDDGIGGRPAVFDLLPKMSAFHKNFGLWICSTGRNSQAIPLKPQKLVDDIPVRPRIFKFYAISHMFDGAGFYWEPESGGRKLSPGDCIIMTPDSIHSYGSYHNKEGKSYTEDTVCFTGPVADNFFKSGIVSRKVFRMGKNRRLIPIIDKALNPSKDSQIEANMSLLNLLTDIYMENKKGPVPENSQNFDLLMKEILRNPSKWWSISEMAEYCNLSESHFRAAFKKHSGLAPKLYLDIVKLRSAAEKLRSTNSSVAEVSGRMGYMDPYHFSRRFKQVIGISPSEYRRLKTRL